MSSEARALLPPETVVFSDDETGVRNGSRRRDSETVTLSDRGRKLSGEKSAAHCVGKYRGPYPLERSRSDVSPAKVAVLPPSPSILVGGPRHVGRGPRRNSLRLPETPRDLTVSSAPCRINNNYHA